MPIPTQTNRLLPVRERIRPTKPMRHSFQCLPLPFNLLNPDCQIYTRKYWLYNHLVIFLDVLRLVAIWIPSIPTLYGAHVRGRLRPQITSDQQRHSNRVSRFQPCQLQTTVPDLPERRGQQQAGRDVGGGR